MSTEITNELLLEEIRKSRQELKSTIEAVEVRILMKIEEQKQRINEIEEKYTELANKVEDIQKKEKENNIVIFGLHKKPAEINIDFITAEIKKLLDIDLSETDLNNFYPLGNKENCPLKLEFVSYIKKASILRNAKKLKGTNISIVNDMTLKQREENKTLRKHLFIAKQNINNTCYIKNNKLYINNKNYTAQELELIENIEEENTILQPRSAPDTPTKFISNKINTVEEPTVEATWRNKIKTLSNIPESFSKEEKEAIAKKTVKETKEDKVQTRSKNK